MTAFVQNVPLITQVVLLYVPAISINLLQQRKVGPLL